MFARLPPFQDRSAWIAQLLRLWRSSGLETGPGAAHILEMETTLGRMLLVLVSLGLAAMGASSLVQIAYDFGLSSRQARAIAMMAALLLGTLLVVEHYGKRKPK
jgi:hypothetical protein